MNLRFRRHLALLSCGLSLIALPALADPWAFAVIGDTSAPGGPDVTGPMIENLKKHFTLFAVQVGNLTPDGRPEGLERPLALAKALADAGIGYYPVRGEREDSRALAQRIQSAFPQTQGISGNFGPATTFVSPILPGGLTGLSYSFEFENTKFLILDQFTRTDGSGTDSNRNVVDQIDWAISALHGKPAEHHAFIFSHRGFFGQTESKGLFGANPAAAPAAQNALFKAMADNHVRYAFSGADRMHHRAELLSPDGQSRVQDIGVPSTSLTFGTPATTPADATANADFRREVPYSQELYHLGYYLVVVDHPRVTVEYWGALNGCGGQLGAGIDCSSSTASRVQFVKRETFGYALNGKQFLVQPGMSFAGITDTGPTGPDWLETRMAILDGKNLVSKKLYDHRLVSKDVNTGWNEHGTSGEDLKSDALTIWGMHKGLGSDISNEYTLSMTYDPKARGSLVLGSRPEQGARDRIYSLNDWGKWEPAIKRNFGGQGKFVVGPWRKGYPLGTHGVDPATHTVWAVLNRGGEFAAMMSDEGDLNGDGLIDRKDVSMVEKLIGKPAAALPAADLDNDGRITAKDARRLAEICTRAGC